ncbi:MAG: DUF5691 domain-containing protein [Verrucomicrobium sp.]|nr:DUF5691 domain-containing protein [Verrucomicrobium sp.]
MPAPFWKQLSTVALLGTSRNPPLPELPGELRELVPSTEEDTALKLLRTAAVAGLAQIAGHIPAKEEAAMPEPAGEDAHPVCKDAQGVALLARIVAEGPDPLIAEACQLLGAAGMCLPYRLLPACLTAARRTSSLRESVLSAAGTRGAWLAAQNSDWRFAATAGIEEIDSRQWDEGDLATRMRYLKELRQREPTQARQLLEKTLPQESARDRVLLLSAIRDNPGLEDEGLLQNLLSNDRSKEVRTLCARLLSALPQSAFAQRMQERLAPCITTEKKLFRTHWVAAPPQAFPKDAALDGIEEKPPGGLKLGERAWWLRQIVARTPLSWWTQHTGMSPLEVVLWSAKTEWKDAIVNGLAEAVTLQATDPAWISAILNAEVLPVQEAVELIAALDEAEQREAWQKLASTGPSFSWWLKQVLKARITWTTAFWLSMEKRLTAHLHTDAAQYDYELRSLLPELACRVPMAATTHPTPWPTTAKSWPSFEEAVHRFQQVLETRAKLREIINVKS